MDSQRQRTVLIADDDHRFLHTVKGIVEREGLRTALAGCGLDALELARKVRPHLTILDVQMPDISGLETYRRLLLVYSALPVIFMTGNLSDDVRQEAISTGAFSILEKPLDVSVFRRTVQRAMEIHL